jgi:hypothetical protein
MKYSSDTIKEVRDYSLAQGTSYALGEIQDILTALEATSEQKALRAMEKELIQARLEVIRLRESVKDWIHDTSREAARAGK